jgi:hypothetical protein
MRCSLRCSVAAPSLVVVGGGGGRTGAQARRGSGTMSNAAAAATAIHRSGQDSDMHFFAAASGGAGRSREQQCRCAVGRNDTRDTCSEARMTRSRVRHPPKADSSLFGHSPYILSHDRYPLPLLTTLRHCCDCFLRHFYVVSLDLPL